MKVKVDRQEPAVAGLEQFGVNEQATRLIQNKNHPDGTSLRPDNQSVQGKNKSDNKFSDKLNLGAGDSWEPLAGWEVVDHKKRAFPHLSHQAWDLPYPDETFRFVFCSHMIEHVCFYKTEEMIAEINRTMKPGGILRILTPDLKKLARAYVNNDIKTMARYVAEDRSGIRQDLGLGQAFMNFIVSGGGDNYILTNDYSTIIAGHAHLYCFDFEMLRGLLAYYGFDDIREMPIHESEIPDHERLRNVAHDADAGHSLVVECRKSKYVLFEKERMLLYPGPGNAWSRVPKKYSALWFAFQAIGHAYNAGICTREGIRKLLPQSVRRWIKAVKGEQGQGNK